MRRRTGAGRPSSDSGSRVAGGGAAFRHPTSRHPSRTLTSMATRPREMTDAERGFRERYSAQPERDALFTTISGEEVEPLYTVDDLPEQSAIGLPGEFPYTRGVYPSMYRGRLWTMRQFAGFGTAEETNERFRYLLDHGQTGLSTAFDMPSLMGHDS